jgi:amino-acid N-acetyltransferase
LRPPYGSAQTRKKGAAVLSAAEEFTFSFATSRDLPAVKELLALCGLPNEDVDQHLRYFILARAEGGLAGVVGLELAGSSGLFRSLAVRPEQRAKGLAATLCRQMIIRARSSSITRLYLLTETEEGFFRKYGFAPVARAKVPREIQTTNEFSKLCSDSATVMVKEL